MPRPLILGGVALIGLALIAALWFGGITSDFAQFAKAQQRDFQNAIARTLRALRGGAPGALVSLLLACFAYGFFHAVGPGHGKIVVGGYGVARAVPLRRLSLIALLASLGQAGTAIILVYAAVFLLNLTREATVGIAERMMAPASYAAITLVGAWLAARGLRGLIRHAGTQRHDHAGTGDTCSHCGHRHGPSIEDVENAGTLREAVAVILGVAMRPCTGALFVLIITWQMGIPAAGIAGALAMAFGTACVTLAVGVAALGVRGGLVGAVTENPVVRWAVPSMELLAGVAVVMLAGGLLLQAL